MPERLLGEVVVSGQYAIGPIKTHGDRFGQIVPVAQTEGGLGQAELQVPHEGGADLVPTAEFAKEIGDTYADGDLFPVGLPVAGIAEILGVQHIRETEACQEGQ